MAKDHLSFSAIQAMRECPARQVAIDKGEYEFPDSQAMKSGRLFEALLCKTEPPQGTTKKDGSFYSWAQGVVELTDRMLEDELIQDFLEGNYQTTMKIDNLVSIPDIINNRKKRVIDIKYTRDFEERYVPELGCRANFIFERNYPLQLAIPALELGYDAFIIAGTSQTPGNFRIFKIPEQFMLTALEDAKREEKRLLAIRREEIPAERCENCAYCRSTATAKIVEATIL